jgi:hypothetical protein
MYAGQASRFFETRRLSVACGWNPRQAQDHRRIFAEVTGIAIGGRVHHGARVPKRAIDAAERMT